MAQALRIKEAFVEQRIFAIRTVVAGVAGGLLIAALIARLVGLQVVNYEHYSTLSQGNRIRIVPVSPTRGLIYDRDGVLLAENLPVFRLELTPEQTSDVDETLARLVEIGLVRPDDFERIHATIARSRHFDSIPLRFRLDDHEVARFAVRRQSFPGVEIRSRLARYYPLSGTAVHALGYMGAINEEDAATLDKAAYAGTSHNGKLGIERAFENILHGKVGHKQVLVNAQGRELDTYPDESALAGRNIQLTLDAHLQRAAEAALGGHTGAIVAIDPRSGDVLVFASAPTFDPNPFGEGLTADEYARISTDPDKPLFNRALRGTYPPGSTIKPLLALAGLATGTVTEQDSIWCPGFYRLPGHTHRYRDWRGHGRTDLRKAIVESCDVYFYQLARDLQIDGIHDFLAKFGLGEKTGIEIAGEAAGVLPSREWKRNAFRNRADQVWFPGETIITGIGQGYMLTSPLQLAHATAILAARGKAFRPRMVSAIENADGVLEPIEPEGLPPVQLSDDTWDTVLESMEGVLRAPTGTARGSAVGAPYRYAGKTGTAQVYSIGPDEEFDGGEVPEHLRDHALFLAFAPIDEPEIALAVLVEHGGGGSRTAAPVARAVLDAYFGVDET